jgi:hypothetical protein
MDEENAARDVIALGERVTTLVRPLLAGRHPAVQGGVLAQLVATWLAGHAVLGNVDGTRGLRAQLLADFLIAVERLVPLHADELGTPHDPIDTTGPDPFKRQ